MVTGEQESETGKDAKVMHPSQSSGLRFPFES